MRRRVELPVPKTPLFFFTTRDERRFDLVRSPILLCLTEVPNDTNPVCVTKPQLAALLCQSAAAGLANPSPTPIDPASAHPPLTVTEFARMGGKARAEKLSPERRREIASQAGKKGGRPRKATLRESPLTTGRSLTPRVSKKST